VVVYLSGKKRFRRGGQPNCLQPEPVADNLRVQAERGELCKSYRKLNAKSGIVMRQLLVGQTRVFIGAGGKRFRYGRNPTANQWHNGPLQR